MEENKLNEEELKKVAGGSDGYGGDEPGDRAHITRATVCFKDKNMGRPDGTLREGTEVYMLGFYKGSRGNCFLVRFKHSAKQVYVPNGTLREGWDD